jgi:hypothetical protein
VSRVWAKLEEMMQEEEYVARSKLRGARKVLDFYKELLEKDSALVKRAASALELVRTPANPDGIAFKDLKDDLRDLIHEASGIDLAKLREEVQEAKHLVAFWTHHKDVGYCFKIMSIWMTEAQAAHGKGQGTNAGNA